MKILYFHQYYNTPESGGPLRSYHFSKALVKAGNEVNLITAHNAKEYIIKEIEGVTVHYLPIYYDNKLGFWGRIKAFIKFTFMAFKVGKKIKSELNFASSTPLTIGITTLLLKITKGTPYIFEIRDIWPNAPIELGIIKNRLIIKITLWLEKIIYKNARSLIALSEGMARHIHEIAPGKKVKVITNVSDINFFKANNTTSSSNVLTISYFGAAGMTNNLTEIIHTAEYFQKLNFPSKFIIAAKGSELEKIKKSAKNLRNISFTDYLKRDNLMSLLSKSDFTYLSFIDFPSMREGSPNKLFDSLAAGVPIITNIPGWWKKVLLDNNCGLYYPTGKPNILLDLIKAFQEDPQKLNEYKSNARRLAEANYNIQLLANKFVGEFHT